MAIKLITAMAVFLHRRVVGASLKRKGIDVKPEDINFRVTQI
jgi:hypothetical protein